MRKDRRTDVQKHDKANSRSSQFCECVCNTNAQCAQNVKFVNAKPGGNCIIKTGLCRVGTSSNQRALKG